MNGKRCEIPVTPPERELQRCYYSPSIFLTSSQTAPAPLVVLTLTQDGNPQRIALNLHDLMGKWGTVNSLLTHLFTSKYFHP